MPLLYHNNNSISNITSFAQIPSGSLTLLSTSTASGSSSISFTSGIDSTYDVYKFEFINIHASAVANFNFNLSTDGGSNYNVTKTTTFVQAYHSESGSGAGVIYDNGKDLAQSTADQIIDYGLKIDNDANSSGTLHLFNPSSSVFVKHFMSRCSDNNASDFAISSIVAGYGNTTSPVNAIIFRMSSGNIDAGTIKMYGIKA